MNEIEFCESEFEYYKKHKEDLLKDIQKCDYMIKYYKRRISYIKERRKKNYGKEKNIN